MSDFAGQKLPESKIFRSLTIPLRPSLNFIVLIESLQTSSKISSSQIKKLIQMVSSFFVGNLTVESEDDGSIKLVRRNF
jgi:hypothetical protein